jgi:hypothetical protein
MSNEKFNDEHELQEWLSKFMKKCGWNVKTEVIPDEAKKWKNPYRIDLIVKNLKHEELNPIGIELKFSRGIQKGMPLAKAFHQLMFKYRNMHYNGRLIKAYCIGIYNSPDPRAKKRNKEYLIDAGILIEGFINYFGIGFLDLNRDDLRIEWCPSRSWCKLPIGHKEYGLKYLEDKAVPQKIIDRVQEGIKRLTI